MSKPALIRTPAASKFIQFVGDFIGDKRVWRVESIRTGEELGGLVWYPLWRQWVFIPEFGTIWSEDCLAAVREQLLSLNGKG